MAEDSSYEIIPLLISGQQRIETKYVLRRDLKYVHGFAFIAGMLLGSGIFISPGLVAASSPSMLVAILAWILSGLVSLLGASCYCELASLFDKTGGTYLYVCRTYHPVFGFALAWIYVLVVVPVATAIISFSSGAHITKMFIEEETSSLFLWTARAIGVTLLLTLSTLNAFGVRKFGIMQNVFGASQILIVAFVIGLGVWHLATVGDFDNFKANVFVNNTDKLLTWNGVRGFGDAIYAALWAYEGWNSVPFLMEELENPSRNVPLVTFTSIPFVIFTYVLINLAFMMALSKEEMGKSVTVGITLAAKVAGNKITFLMPLLVAVSCFGALNSSVYVASRICMTAAREGHLPSVFLWIHKKYRTPILAIVCNFFVCLAWILLGNGLKTFISYFNFCVWLAYILTFIAILRLRYSQPYAIRTYKVFLATPVVMTLISFVIAFLGVAASPVGCGVSIAFIISSLPVYYFLVHRPLPLASKLNLLKVDEHVRDLLARMDMVPSEAEATMA